jgi:hypothetical protein
MGPMWEPSPRLSAVEAIHTPQGFQSPSNLMAPCRITQHFLDRSATVAGLLVHPVFLVSLVQPNKQKNPINQIHQTSFFLYWRIFLALCQGGHHDPSP